MKKLTTLFVWAIANSCLAANPSFTIDATHPVGNVSPRLYGLMTEEINHSYDGGLYAELIRNRAFLDNTNTPENWSVVHDDAAAANITLVPDVPYNDALKASLRLTVTQADKKHSAGVANAGYWGIPVQPRTRYRVSLIARGVSNISTPITVSIVSDDGRTVYASKRISGLAVDWKKFETTLTTGKVEPTTKAHFAITLNQPDTVWLSFVSVFPPTWNNRPNGLRKDLMQMMVDMNPKFLRFPGGNYVEGDTVESRFDWKKTVGLVEQRPGHACPWGYRSSDGLGLLEFLEWCEDMKAEPLLAVYAGYNLKGTHVNPGPDLEPFVQEALDEIEYVTGDTKTKWGAQRAKDGHPAPFKLHYVEIGNEDWFDKSGSYDARFVQFDNAIKAHYPQLKTISTIGNDQPEKARVKGRQPDMTDEHYYRSVDEFLRMSPDYAQKYPRSGPEIFVGEWAAYETPFVPWDNRSHNEPPTPNLRAAIGDAAFMAAMERASNLILMQCYAPMLVNVNPGARQWRPNLIGYDAMNSYGSPSYYAIQTFSRNLGDEILSTASAETSVQGCATRSSRSGEIFLKLVNPGANAEPINVSLKGVASVASKAEVITIAGNSDDTNSITQRKKVLPVKSVFNGVKPEFVYPMPPNSIVVINLKARQ